MPLRFRAPSARSILIALVVVGLAVRAAGLLWGIAILPFTGNYHPDEGATFEHAVGFPKNFLATGSFVHGSAVPHLVALVLLPVKFKASAATWRLTCHLAMRVVSVLCATASIVVTYHLGTRLWERTTGLIAAAMLTLSFTHVANAAYATQDVLMSFFVAGAFLLQLRAFETTRISDFVKPGIVFGFLPGIKVSAGVLLALPLVQLGARKLAQRLSGAESSAKKDLLGLLALYAGAAVIFCLTSPRDLVNLHAFLDYWRDQKHMWFDRTAVGWTEIPSIWWHISVQCFGMAVVVLALVGMLLMLRRPSVPRVMTAFAVALYLLFHRHYLLPRFMASVAPLVCVFGAYPLACLLRQSKLWMRIPAAAGLAVILVAASVNCARICGARWNDPRTQAAKWLAKNVPRGTPVAVASIYGSITSWENPPLERLPLRSASLADRPPFVVMSSISEQTMTTALASPRLQRDYTWDPTHLADWYNYQLPSPAVFQTFAALFKGEGYRKVAWFPPPAKIRIEFADVGVSIYAKQ